jgi:hypothetical protein
MKVKDFVSYIDFPDIVTVIIYSYDSWDDIFSGLCVDIPEYLLQEDVNGFEIPGKNTIILNIHHK